MVNLKGTWSHNEDSQHSFQSLQMYTDLCLFFFLQCTVLPARSYGEMDMYFSAVSVRMLESKVGCWGGF